MGIPCARCFLILILRTHQDLMPKKKNKARKNVDKNPEKKGVWNSLPQIPTWAWWMMAGAVALAYSWAFYSFFVEPFGFRWRALYGDPSYPQGYSVHGIDISHHQGEIDWTKLSNAMIDKNTLAFIMVKATEGSDYLDDCFEENFKMAKEVGFIRGAYHFWSTVSTAREQAAFFLDNVKLEVGDLPPVLDVEAKADNMSEEDFQMELLAWLHIVEDRYHVKPIIYTYYKFKERYLKDERFDAYPYWIAHYYVSEVQYKGKWKFWQHTDVGRLPGIKGYVDFDIYNGSRFGLKKLTISEEQLNGPTLQETDTLALDSIDYDVNDSAAQSPDTIFD